MHRLSELTASIFKGFISLSPILRIGITVFMIAGALDLSYHTVSAVWPGSLDRYMGPDGYYAHLALFFGMVLIVIGVIRTKPAQKSRMDPVKADSQSINNKGGVY